MYPHVFVAGTFDRLHKGHEAVLLRAFAEGEKVTIGLTSDTFVAAYKKNKNIQSFQERKQGLIEFLPQKNYVIISIDDPYSPADTADLDALVVTADNHSRGEEINTRRQKNGLAPLALIDVPVVPAADTKPISATRIRAGEIDPTGRLIMPDNLRPELARPLGTLCIGDAIGTSIETHRMHTVITVGDVTTTTMKTAGVVPALAIVDFLVGRKPYHSSVVADVTVVSGPGFIGREAIAIIQQWAKNIKPMILVVHGEEDLLTIPAVAYGPVGAVVYYGQPGRGMVEVVVTEEKKYEARLLLDKFRQV